MVENTGTTRFKNVSQFCLQLKQQIQNVSRTTDPLKVRCEIKCRNVYVSLSRQVDTRPAVHHTNHDIKRRQMKCLTVEAMACQSVYPPVPGYVIVTYESA